MHTNKTNRDHSLEGVSVAEARSVSRLCDRSAADVVRPRSEDSGRRFTHSGCFPATVSTSPACKYLKRVSPKDGSPEANFRF